MANIKPLNGTVAIKRVEDSEQSYGQIVIPDLGKEKPELGVVIATSDTYNWHKGAFVKSNLQPGQMVLIPRMGAMIFSMDMEDYVLIKENEVLCIIEN